MEEYENIMPSSPTMVHKHNISAIERDSTNDNLDDDTICTMFDEFLHEFEAMEKSGNTTTQMFLNAVEEITNAVLQIKPNKLLHLKVISHPLVDFLNQMIVDIVRNWRASELRLNIQESDIFLKIVLIFVRAVESISPENVEVDRSRVETILATKQLTALIREQINDNTINKKGLNDDPNICTLGLATIKLFSKYQFYFSQERNACLFDNLVYNCLDSFDYAYALRHIQQDEPVNEVETFLLNDCWKYVPFVGLSSKYAVSASDSNNYVNDIYDDFLTKFEEALDQQPSTTPNGLTYIFERCEQLLNIPNLRSFNKHAQNLIDRLVKILQNSTTNNTNNDEVVTVALKAFRSLSKNADIRSIMKQQNLTSLFQQYTSVSMDEKRTLAYHILGEILNEDELVDAYDITSFFIDELKQLDPNQHDPKLDETLESLNVLTQHEKVKEEFIKQGGLEILSRFIRDGDPNKKSEKQQEYALKILWSCAFHSPEVLEKLKQDQQLMKSVNQLLEKSTLNQNSSLEKAAEGFLWKVEKEEQFLQEQAAEAEKKKQEKKRKAQESGKEEDEDEEEEEPKYDMMMSYSWADMDLTHRIFHHLTEKLGYKVWLDQEQMHGSTIQAMANAVEGAEFILMCMSETYKRSANCQSEAEYAFNRKKHIVPLKMKKDYVPDGWLGFILGTRMYIDFGTYEFDKAIELLDNEIKLQKKKRKEAKEIAKLEKLAATAGENEVVAQEGEVKAVNGKKAKFGRGSALDWDAETVREFLLKQNLTPLVPICNGIDGEELANLYTMCHANPTSMFRSLKFELLHGYNRILPISTYLRFLTCMRSVTDDALLSNSIKSKKSHSVSSLKEA